MIKPLTLSQRLLERADASDEDCRTDDGDIMREADEALKAKDAEIAELTVVVGTYREAQDAEWHPIATCPIQQSVDLWCVYGGEDYAQYDGGASIGKLVSNRHKTVEYGFFGNQSNDGVPQGHARDLVPVAWRPAVPSCPASLIAEVLNVPLTYEDAVAKKKSDA